MASLDVRNVQRNIQTSSGDWFCLWVWTTAVCCGVHCWIVTRVILICLCLVSQRVHNWFYFQANLADYSDNQWVTCFQDTAEAILGKSGEELGQLREQVFDIDLWIFFFYCQLKAPCFAFRKHTELTCILSGVLEGLMILFILVVISGWKCIWPSVYRSNI